MTRKSIKVVSLSTPESAAEPVPSHPEADGMNEVLTEMQADPAPTEEPQLKEDVVVPVGEELKPKPKRKPRTKKEAVQETLPPPPPEPVTEEPPEAKPPAASPKEKVSCPDCGKMVSAKTLKYTHKITCKSKQHTHGGVCYQKDEPIEEDEIQRVSCARQMKASRRAEKMAKLAAAAF